DLVSEHPAAVDDGNPDPVEMAQPAPGREDGPEMPPQIRRRARPVEHQRKIRAALGRIVRVHPGIQLEEWDFPALELCKERPKPVGMFMINGNAVGHRLPCEVLSAD